jgi:hypothetical protein
MEKNMLSSSNPYRRPIDAALALLHERLTTIAAIDREAIETVSHDPTAAWRLALLASELRRELTQVGSL